LTGGSLEGRELAADLNDAFSIPLRNLRSSDRDAINPDESWTEDIVESVDLSGSADNSWREERVELTNGARELLSHSDFQEYEERISQRRRSFNRDV